MDKIKVVRSIKRRTISVQILPDASVVVSVPYFFPDSKIKKLLNEKQDWIRQNIAKIKEQNIKKESVSESGLLYLGKKYPLEIRQNQKNIVEFEDKFYLLNFNKSSHKIYLTFWYKQQARKIIQERVYHYSNIAGLEFKFIKITDAETRWGSCSSDKNLNFNWKLIMAPLPVVDYVVVHELAHLVELNHSRSFWETVRKMYPLYRHYRTWLKKNGHMLNIG